MVRIQFLIAAAVLGVSCFSAHAEKSMKQIGNFIISTDEDAFGDGDKVVAMAPQGGAALVLRCLEGELSVAVFEQVDPSHIFSLQYRVDKQEIKSKGASPLSEKIIEIADSADIFDELKGAKQFAVKLDDETQGAFVTSTFELKKIDTVVDVVKKACKK